MKGHIERIREAASGLLAGGGMRRRWRTALGRWPELGRFFEYLESPPSTMPTSRELAQLARIDEQAFRRRVKSAIDLTPIEAVIATKLARSARKLRETEVPVAKIAVAEGFSSLAAFDHSFVRCFGSPPSGFRQLV